MRGWRFQMKWFRSNVRHGARLALFAMLVQFALTFGHSHWLAQAAPLAQPSAQHIESGTKDVAASDGDAAVEKQSPSSPDREHSRDESCAICAIIAMAGAVVSATPPVLLLPQAIALLQRTLDAEFIHLKSAGTAFQPRAPPAS